MKSGNLTEWLGDSDVSVSLTFDVDADVGFDWRCLNGRLTSSSEAKFGMVRGLPRILAVLQRYDIRSTFFVPGEIVEMHPEAIVDILDRGHEVAHHGHYHLWNDKLDDDGQRDEIERGLAAMEKHLGLRPLGYRSPGWEMTPQSFVMLSEHGFLYDSSMMTDDRPYVETVADRELVEFPVHWSLDDWPFFGFQRDTGGRLADPNAVLNTWIGEFESARSDKRHVTYTMHPECIGRGYRIRLLSQLIEHILANCKCRFVTHGQIARELFGDTGELL
ncbi:polysaccharide deacetylase family protein [Qaidamihabitans albus]|uniref:polysaccharide deacetylase family protein n=1 Tax=Qaidamihabitans albus TaxID=2795733 RepID=UPI0018F1838B|nr:polysaccharide deacetylase [Qaidamihabitans albus]